MVFDELSGIGNSLRNIHLKRLVGFKLEIGFVKAAETGFGIIRNDLHKLWAEVTADNDEIFLAFK
jgi:hypothetical protein